MIDSELTARQKLDRAVELLDNAHAFVEEALGDTDAAYSFKTQISQLASQLHAYEIVSDENTRTIELIVRVTVRDSADIEDVVNNCNYEFVHEDIVSTEIVDVNTEI